MGHVMRGAMALGLVLLAACGEQQMANQPRHEPLDASTFFVDGRSSRHLVPGTVAQGQLQGEEPLYTGRIAGEAVTALPLPLTRDLLAHGRERYAIYCSPCHDQVGTGQGMIVQRGYPRPPSFHIPRLRQAPLGHFFVVMTEGYGTMPNYGYLLTPPDGWAIAAYIRVLQLSQYAPVAELPPEVRQQLDQ
jgi:mono/diheme cytochrome c family protein